jgi:hypothetical protein
MEFLENFSAPVIVGICLCIGFILKHAIKTDKINDYIPLIMGVLGTLLNVWLENWFLSPEILLTGLFSGLASTGLHQAFSKIIKKEEK